MKLSAAQERAKKAGNAAAFEIQIRNDIAETKEQFNIIVQKVLFLALRRIIARSPVDTGRFKNNWWVSPGTMNREITRPAPAVKSSFGVVSGESVIEGEARITAYDAMAGPHVVYIYNNLPYAVALEFGHSRRQAPNGIVSLVVPELEAMFEGAA